MATTWNGSHHLLVFVSIFDICPRQVTRPRLWDETGIHRRRRDAKGAVQNRFVIFRASPRVTDMNGSIHGEPSFVLPWPYPFAVGCSQWLSNAGIAGKSHMHT